MEFNRSWGTIFKFLSNSCPSSELGENIFDQFFKERPNLNENQVMEIIQIFNNAGNLKNCKNFDTFHILFTIRYFGIIEKIGDNQLKSEWFNNENFIMKLQILNKYKTNSTMSINSAPCSE